MVAIELTLSLPEWLVLPPPFQSDTTTKFQNALPTVLCVKSIKAEALLYSSQTNNSRGLTTEGAYKDEKQ